jgi:hypothetical protein
LQHSREKPLAKHKLIVSEDKIKGIKKYTKTNKQEFDSDLKKSTSHIKRN